jgi:hypothetical protein
MFRLRRPNPDAEKSAALDAIKTLQQFIRGEVSAEAAERFPAWYLREVASALERCPELDTARLGAFCRAKAFEYVATELTRQHCLPD